MNNTMITNLNLLCEAEIEVQTQLDDSVERPIFKYSLHNKPCFGIYFRAFPNSNDRKRFLINISASVYQFLDRGMLTEKEENNYCSLTPQQLSEYHRELEKVFAKTATDGAPTNLKISVVETTRTYDKDEEQRPKEIPAIRIDITADYMYAYQFLVLLTLIRLSSEYPNALLLRECCNLQEHGYFREFSKLSLFGLLQNRLQYAYDQGPIPYISDSTKTFFKPSCLEFLAKRVTVGTDEYERTGRKVQNFFEIVDRGEKNIAKFNIPRYYPGGGNSTGGDKLYPTDSVISKIFNGEIIEEHLPSFQMIRDAIYYQFPKLKTDHPEVKRVKNF